MAVVLPNHATIDEKIADGTLTGFRHVYGHTPEMCQQSDVANALIRKGYSPGQLLCPDCPAAAGVMTPAIKHSLSSGKTALMFMHICTATIQRMKILSLLMS